MIVPCSLMFKAIGHVSFILPYLLECKKVPHCVLERVGDIDPIGVVYLSFGGGELSQDHSNWLLTVRPTLSSIGIYCTFLK